MSDWRETREYRVWRATVIRRDVKCQCCGSLKDRHAHHVQHATYRLCCGLSLPTALRFALVAIQPFITN